MYLVKTAITLSAALVVGACSTTTTTTPPVPGAGTASLMGGVYSVTQNGKTVSTFGASSAVTGGLLSWNNPTVRAYIRDDVDFVAAAIVDRTDGDKVYAGISGTAAAAVPTSGIAAYTGRYGLVRVTAAHGGVPWGFIGAQTSIVDFSTGSVIGAGGTDGFSYRGTVSGTEITGTMSFTSDGAVTAPITGGFYGANTLAGAFSADGITGIFYGTNP